MEYATLTNQNQITVPMKIRDKLSVKPGDKLVFYDEGENVKVVKLKSVRDFDGLLKDSKHKICKKDTSGVWTERYNNK